MVGYAKNIYRNISLLLPSTIVLTQMHLVVLFYFVELLTSNLFVHWASCLSEVGNQVM